VEKFSECPNGRHSNAPPLSNRFSVKNPLDAARVVEKISCENRRSTEWFYLASARFRLLHLFILVTAIATLIWIAKHMFLVVGSGSQGMGSQKEAGFLLYVAWDDHVLIDLNTWQSSGN
jgi:hypothetical protein